MILGIGQDVVSLARFAGVVERVGVQRLARRILATSEQKELEMIDARDRQVRLLAARFAVKEAFFKATAGIGEATWKEVHVEKSDRGAPLLRVSERLTTQLGIGRSHATIAHDGDYLVASVILESKE